MAGPNDSEQIGDRIQQDSGGGKYGRKVGDIVHVSLRGEHKVHMLRLGLHVNSV